MANFEPIFVSIFEALRISGLGRTRLYEELSAGRIAARKCGRRTLIDVQSLRDYVAALPEYRPEAPPRNRTRASDASEAS